ncbi:MAG: aspartate 1-decarboxylase [Bacteroidota bacterium]|nr:aspartate 1-decarboxylase [Bacteroidota bacterium]
MLLQILRVKIQELIVSESSPDYPGSIALPQEIIEASGLKLFEQVHVNNLTNGNRIITYVIKSDRNGFVSLNGAASKKFNKGDKIHVLAFGYVNINEQNDEPAPVIVHTDKDNRLIEAKKYSI